MSEQDNNDNSVQGQYKSGDLNSVSGPVERGGIVIQGSEHHVEIHQNFSTSSGVDFKPHLTENLDIEYFEPETILIPEGWFWMGLDAGERVPAYETPRHKVFLPSYRVAKKPVTNEQYRQFIYQTDRPVKEVIGWVGRKIRAGYEKNPVMGVRWEDALEYCKWLSKERSRNYSLPTEAHLEKAYQGFYDIFNNIHEWTCTLWGERPDVPDEEYFYPWCEDGRNNLNFNLQIRRVVCAFPKIDTTESTANRFRHRSGQLPSDPGLPGERHSFRVVMTI